MENREKIAKLEEMMELEEGSLTEETLLDDVDEWDSVAAISYIALLDEEFGVSISAKEIKSFKTVADAISYMHTASGCLRDILLSLRTHSPDCRRKTDAFYPAECRCFPGNVQALKRCCVSDEGT